MSAGEIINFIGAIAGAIALLGGATGLGFWYKARQDGKSSLSSSEAGFRKDLLGELRLVQEELKKAWADNRAAVVSGQALQERINQEVEEGARRSETIAQLSKSVDKFTAVSLERDKAIRDRDKALELLKKCRFEGGQERILYEERIAELEAKITELEAKLHDLTKKKVTDEQSEVTDEQPV